MRRWIWNKFGEKWFRSEVTEQRKVQNQRNYIKGMLKHPQKGLEN
jgi:hypothetical protein